MSNTIFTLGYEKRTLPEFIEILMGSGITALVDVRETPWSHKPGFSKGVMSEQLAQAGIAYHHAKFAGNPKRIRVSAATGAEVLVKYREYLEETPAVMEEFEDLVERLHDDGQLVCLCCFERAHGDCHRGVLAEGWSEGRSARRVVHL